MPPQAFSGTRLEIERGKPTVGANPTRSANSPDSSDAAARASKDRFIKLVCHVERSETSLVISLFPSKQ